MTNNAAGTGAPGISPATEAACVPVPGEPANGPCQGAGHDSEAIC